MADSLRAFLALEIPDAQGNQWLRIPADPNFSEVLPQVGSVYTEPVVPGQTARVPEIQRTGGQLAQRIFTLALEDREFSKVPVSADKNQAAYLPICNQIEKSLFFKGEVGPGFPSAELGNQLNTGNDDPKPGRSV